MTPEQLAKSGTEHAEQMALFCWANKAAREGFEAARVWIDPAASVQLLHAPVPCLNWLHAIPNAGARGNKVAAAQLKAEGVKAGIADVCLPYFARYFGVQNDDKPDFEYCGLYIELKRASGVPSDVSDEQLQFAKYVTEQNYAWGVAFGWRQAAALIEAYVTCVTPILTPKQARVLALVAAK